MKYIALILLLLTVSACSNQAPPALIDMRLVASQDLNPDHAGRPSPMVIKLIELSSTENFNEANFFDLYANAPAALGNDIVAEEEFILRPSTSRYLKLQIQPDSRYIAIIGGYQQLENANWKFIHPVLRHDKDIVELAITKDKIIRVRYPTLVDPERLHGSTKQQAANE